MTAVGIDLGTTNSCVAVWRGGKTEVLLGFDGLPVTPSVVAEADTGEWRAGMLAKRFAETNPEHTYWSVKRLIGRAFTDPQVALTQEVSAFAIAPADNGEAWIQGRERLHPPAEISAHVLRRLKASAELALGRPVKEAVITVPAYFNDAQRKATLEAGEIAELKVLRIINEPTAAALALDLDNVPATVAIYDLGGGTFDLSVLTIGGEGDADTVIATNGDTFLGGDDWDRALLNELADDFLNQYGVDPRKDPIQRQRLKLAAEDAKKELSFVEAAQVSLDTLALVGEERRPMSLIRNVSRDLLEQLTADLVERTIAICRATLEEAGLKPADLDRVILVGGQTRAPAVQAAVKAFFGGVTVLAPDPDQIVARGAAVMAAALTGQLAIELEDVTPFQISVQTADDKKAVVIEANAKIPCQVTKPFTTQTDDQDAVTVRLRQGNAPAAHDDLPLGRFHLEGVRPARDGRRIIDLTVDIDADGVMMASARDRGSGRRENLTVETMGLSPRAIERMRKLAANAAKAQNKAEAA